MCSLTESSDYLNVGKHPEKERKKELSISKKTKSESDFAIIFKSIKGRIFENKSTNSEKKILFLSYFVHVAKVQLSHCTV